MASPYVLLLFSPGLWTVIESFSGLHMLSSCGFLGDFAHVAHRLHGRSVENANARVFLREGVCRSWRWMGERGEQEVDGDGETGEW